jgi:hypothetical protein
MCHEIQPITSKDRAMHEGDHLRFEMNLLNLLLTVLFIFIEASTQGFKCKLFCETNVVSVSLSESIVI